MYTSHMPHTNTYSLTQAHAETRESQSVFGWTAAKGGGSKEVRDGEPAQFRLLAKRLRA